MIKQTVSYGVWTINRHDDNKIEVYKSGLLCDKSAPALREIAVEIGLEVNPEWRTSQLGANVVKAILLDATPTEIQQEKENKLQAQSLTDGRFMFPIHELYDGKNINTKLLRPIPFIYRWWFIEGSKPMQLLEQYIQSHSDDIDMLHTKAHLKTLYLNGHTY